MRNKNLAKPSIININKRKISSIRMEYIGKAAKEKKSLREVIIKKIKRKYGFCPN